MIDRSKLMPMGAALALSALLATAGHAQTVTPTSAAEPAVQRYRLVEFAGSALPVEVEREWKCRESLTRASLTLESDSVWVLRSAVREECGDRAEVENEVEHGRYASDGTNLRFFDDDEGERDWELLADTDFDDLETGTLAADGTLTVKLRDGERSMVFRP